MTTQVFRAPTLEDAKTAAKTALGADAVVLTTRNVPRNGLGGMFGKFDVEIAAAAVAADELPPITVRSTPRPKNALFASGAYTDEPAARTASPKPPADPLTTLRSELRGEIRAMRVSIGRQSQAPKADSVATELSAMRSLLEELAVGRIEGQLAEGTNAILKASGIEGGALAELARAMKKADPNGTSDESDSSEEVFRNALADMIQVTAWPLAHDGRQIISLVGPTGVGKTTTLAKLATHAITRGQTVTFITCDTFRVGGVAQTQRYAELLDCPWFAATTAEELEKAIAASTTDLVLVDTSGRQPDDDAAEKLLSDDKFLARCQAAGLSVRVHLVMSASVRAADAARIVKTFSAARPTAIAVTKLDETDVPSGLVHSMYAAKLPLALTTAGQRVPEDITPATKGGVLDAFTRKLSGSLASLLSRTSKGIDE